MFAGLEERFAEVLGDLEDGEGSWMESGAGSGDGSADSGDDD